MAVDETLAAGIEKWEATSSRALKNLEKQNPRGMTSYKKILTMHETAVRSHRFSTPELILYLELWRIGLPVEHHAKPGRYEMDMFISFYKELGVHCGIDIECDGEPWHHTKQAKARDIKRDKEMVKQGFLVVRINSTDIESRVINTARLVKRVYASVKSDPSVLLRPESLGRIAAAVLKSERNLGI